MAISQLYPNQRPTLNLNFARSKTLDPRITFTRNSTATYVGSDGLIKTAAAGEARFNHGPGTGDCRGLLIEPSRTNKFPYSTFATGWGSQGAVIASTTELAPDGTNTACAIYGSSGPGTKALIKSSNQNGTGVNIFSFYAKATQPGAGQKAWISYFAGGSSNTSSPYFSLDTGEITGYVGTPIQGDAEVYSTYHGDGWWRIHLKMTPTGVHNWKWSAGTTSQNGNILIWGAQLEEGTYETSIIPTSGSTVTRATEDLDITTDVSWFNPSASTLIVGCIASNINSNDGLFTMFNTAGLSQNRVSFRPTNYLASSSDGTMWNTISIGSAANYVNTLRYYAFSHDLNGAKLVTSINTTIPGKVNTDNVAPVGINKGYIGRREENAGRIHGYYTSIAYYPYRLTNSQMQELTQ